MPEPHRVEVLAVFPTKRTALEGLNEAIPCPTMVTEVALLDGKLDRRVRETRESCDSSLLISLDASDTEEVMVRPSPIPDGVLADNAVSDLQKVASEEVTASLVPSDLEFAPKLDPRIVALVAPVTGPLLLTAELVGAGRKLKARVKDPWNLRTVELMVMVAPVPGAVRTRREESEVQRVAEPDVAETLEPTDKLDCPKHLPSTVTKAEPVPGLLDGETELVCTLP